MVKKNHQLGLEQERDRQTHRHHQAQWLTCLECLLQQLRHVAHRMALTQTTVMMKKNHQQ